MKNKFSQWNTFWTREESEFISMGKVFKVKIPVGKIGNWSKLATWQKEIYLLIIACSTELLSDETLACSIKQSTQQRGVKEDKERVPNSGSEEQYPKWLTKGQRNKSRDLSYHSNLLRKLAPLPEATSNSLAESWPGFHLAFQWLWNQDLYILTS